MAKQATPDQHQRCQHSHLSAYDARLICGFIDVTNGKNGV